MLPCKDYISENEASSLCGISPATLNRFVETGYLQVEKDSDGLRLFERGQLTRLFGIKYSVRTDTAPKTAVNEIANRPRMPEKQNFCASEDNTAPEYTRVSDDPAPSEHQGKARPHLRVVSDEQGETGTTGENPAPVFEALERELVKANAINDMLEKLLSIRESQLGEIKTERDWLKERIEKLEENAHKDKLLLLAESQTVRKLVNYQKRSPVRALLEWCGISPNRADGDTINADFKRSEE